MQRKCDVTLVLLLYTVKYYHYIFSFVSTLIQVVKESITWRLTLHLQMDAQVLR